MKRIHQLLVVAAIAVTFTAVNQVVADDAFLSPRAREQRDSLRIVPGTTVDHINRSVQAGSPKSLDLAASLRKVPGTSPDLLNRTYAGMPKLMDQVRVKEFQVAPLK